MKLLLIQEILIEIVSDGVKEMLKRLNFSRRSRRCRWFKEFSQVLDHYKKEIGENLIPVIIEDFKGSIAVKISNNKMDEKEIQEMKKFMEMVKMGDTSQYWTEEDNKKIMNIINDGHDWILNRIDLYIRSEVFRQLQKLSEERSKLETTIYNFTNEEMPEEIRELFKNGVDIVPRVKLSIFEVKNV
jgi:endonuclease III